MIARYVRRVFAVCVLSLMLAASMESQAHGSKQGDQIAPVVSGAVEAFLKRAPQAMGLSVGILRDEETYTYNYGTLEKGGKSAPAANTLYPIASVTKTFTGTLLAIAGQEGKVKLDDDVRRYLDGNYPNLEYQGHPIHLDQLVNHNSGLPFNLPDIPENRPPFPPMTAAVTQLLDGYSRKDFLADLHKVEIKTMPGEKFSYSNSAAVLLSIVLERVYGMPYEEIVKRKIARPLGMQDTTITVNEEQAKRLAKGYDEKGLHRTLPSGHVIGRGSIEVHRRRSA